MLEVLLALGLIALLGGVLIGGGSNLLADKPQSAEDVFWKTVQECRKQALKEGKDVRLGFDQKDKKFVVSDAAGVDAGTKDFPITAATDLTVTFLTTQKGASMMLIGGVAVETQTLPSVTFYADGTCMPFRLQIQQGASAQALAIDPWTCAPVLVAKDPNAP